MGFWGGICDSFLPAQNTLGTLKLFSDDKQLKISVPLGLATKYRAQIYNLLMRLGQGSLHAMVKVEGEQCEE